MTQFSFLSAEDGFLGLETPDINDIADTDVVVVPFGLERTVSYTGGTSKGPQAIIDASHQVELFDEDLWLQPFDKIKVATMKSFAIEKNLEKAVAQIEKITTDILDAKKFPMILGGEHSLSAGVINAYSKKYPKISILHFDAHADLRDGYDGERYSHAAALCRCLDNDNVNLVSIGIRNISGSEIPFLEKNKDRLKIYWAKDKDSWDINQIISDLKGLPTYISFDLDGFDSSLMPATGTPEPGGIFWNDAMKIIKLAAEKCDIIGSDIVELAPIPGFHACDFLSAKLAFKIIAYSFAKKLKT